MDGRRVPFDRDKILKSMAISLRKRPITPEQQERAVNGVVRRLESLGENEISTQIIGEMIMDALASLDEVAYVRFASVYQDFRGTKDFSEFIGNLSTKD